MAVYTKIDNRDLLSLSDSYKLGKITKSKGIKKGIENTNYLLKTDKKNFILNSFFSFFFHFYLLKYFFNNISSYNVLYNYNYIKLSKL